MAADTWSRKREETKRPAIKLGRFGQSKDTGRKINYVTDSLWRSRYLGESQEEG